MLFIVSFIIAQAQQPEQLSWDVAKQIIQTQNNIAIIGISVLVGVAVLLLGGTWIYNVYLNTRRLNNIADNLSKKIAIDLTKKADEIIKTEIDKMKEEIKKDLDEKLILFEAEKARLFALSCKQSNNWESCGDWWATAIINYAKVKIDKGIRISVDALNTALDKCEKLDAEKKKNIEKCLDYIPSILDKERKEIEAKLKKLG